MSTAEFPAAGLIQNIGNKKGKIFTLPSVKNGARGNSALA